MPRAAVAVAAATNHAIKAVPAFYLFDEGELTTSFAGADPNKLKEQIEALAVE